MVSVVLCWTGLNWEPHHTASPLFAVGGWLPGAVAPMLPLRPWLLVRCPGAELADGAEAVADHCLKARRLKSGAGRRIEFLI